MVSIPSRERLTYLAMSAFVAFHTLVMMMAPNNSATGQAFRLLVQPYLSFFSLESTWSFFAPTVSRDSHLRYVIEDAAGTEHTFVPTQELSWFLPSDLWFENWYYGIIEDPENFADSFAAFSCRKHASLKPRSVTLLEIQEQDFWREDYLAGNRPLDREFVAVNTLTRIECRDGSAPARHSPIRPSSKPS